MPLLSSVFFKSSQALGQNKKTSAFLLASLLSLSACTTQNPSKTSAADNANHNQTQVASEQANEQNIEEAAAKIPERPLDEETMSAILMAEFALYRQNYPRALALYEQLANETQDAGVAKRATEIAMGGQDPFRALDLALLYLDLKPKEDRAIELASRALARTGEVEGAWALIYENQDKTQTLRLVTIEAARLAAQIEDNYQLNWLLEEILASYGADSEDPEVQLSIGLLYESLGNNEQAEITCLPFDCKSTHCYAMVKMKRPLPS